MYKKTAITSLSSLTTVAIITACSGPSDKHLGDASTSVSESPVAIAEIDTYSSAAENAASVTTADQILLQTGPEQRNKSSSRHITSIARNAQTIHPKPQILTTNLDTYPIQVDENTENYQALDTNPIHVTSAEPVSTFSIDVDTGSYANVRRFLNGGKLPPADSVRIEEMLNYFSYDYTSTATQSAPFSMTTELGATPWNDNTTLLHVGLKGFDPGDSNDRPSNLVFLIDVSGSMNGNNKLGLLKPSIEMLSRQLDSNDRVSIVVYAGASGVVLEPTPGNEHRKIASAINRLSAGGSTNGQAGIELAYAMAEKSFTKDGVNRVILATDGDFNVGLSDIEKLKTLIERKRESGIALTTLGFGTGNYNDHLMEQLADVGNGNYAYIDTINEARKVLVDELTATLLTIAHDVKIQIEFNPAVVSEYRLIGYTNRKLANEDFNNDKVDAGEIGAGHTVTALYELALVGSGGERHSPSRYSQLEQKNAQQIALDELGEIRIRYKLPGEKQSRLIREVISTQDSPKSDAPSDNFRFSASVAAFAQALNDGKYLESFTLTDTARLARSAIGEDAFGYRAELLRLITIADSLTGIAQSGNAINDDSNG